MAIIIKYVALLAAVTNIAVAFPQGNSDCAKWCQTNYSQCGFKNVGECSSHAAKNGNTCGCCPKGGEWCSEQSKCVEYGKCTKTTIKTTPTTYKTTTQKTETKKTETMKTTPTKKTETKKTDTKKTTPTKKTETKNTETKKTETKKTETPKTTPTTYKTTETETKKTETETTKKTDTETTKKTETTPTTYKTTQTSTKTAATSTPTDNNGQIFKNQCTNRGISIANCAQLLNIAALNGNSISVGGDGSGTSDNPVNNGQQFFNYCRNSGISLLNCSQVLNLAILNGNNIDISLTDLTALITQLGLSLDLLSGLPTASNGLIEVPAGLF